MPTNIILTGGIFHPFGAASRALSDILAGGGVSSVIFDDVAAGLRALHRSQADMLTVYALRWTMTQHEKYAPHRVQWAMSLSDEGRAAVTRHLARGGALLALHTAVICFDDWAGWGDMLGARWVWGRSSHPPFGRVDVRLTQTPGKLAAGLETFGLDDEVYQGLEINADVAPLAEARALGAEAGWQTVAWTREHGGGRVAVDLLGHDGASLEQPEHRALLRRAALWALGRDAGEAVTR